MTTEGAESSIRILNPVEDDRIVVTRLSGKEGVSRLFSFNIHLKMRRNETRRIDALLGQSLTVELRRSGGPSRQFTGLVRRVRQLAEKESLIEYSVALVPPVWPLSQNRRTRIFRDLSTPEVLKAVFDGFAVEFHLREEYPRQPNTVQYRESDFAFASRLMEESGIYYYFEFADAACRLAIADASPQAAPVDGRYETRYRPGTGTTRHVTSISEWRVRRQLTPNQVVIATQLPDATGKAIQAESSGADTVRVGANEEFLSPPGFHVTVEEPAIDQKRDSHEWHSLVAASQRQARRRIQRWQRESIVIDGASDCPHFVPGCQFLFSSAGEQGGEYFITRVEHHATPPSEPAANVEYSNRFRCVPRDLPYRPTASTPRPSARGMRFGFVIGPVENEIHTDPHGRVKVQFAWTSEGQAEDFAAWLPVAQHGGERPWAPKVGQQVLVGFLEGEVDRPFVVGTVGEVSTTSPIVAQPPLPPPAAVEAPKPSRDEMEERLQKFTAEPPASEPKPPRPQKSSAKTVSIRPELPHDTSLHQVIANLDDRKAVWVGCLAMAELVRNVAAGNIPASQLGVVDEAAEWVIRPVPSQKHAVEAAAMMVSNSSPAGAIGQAVALARNEGGIAQASIVAHVIAAIRSAAEQYLAADRRSDFEGQVLVIARDVYFGRQLWQSDNSVDLRSRFGHETTQ